MTIYSIDNLFIEGIKEYNEKKYRICRDNCSIWIYKGNQVDSEYFILNQNCFLSKKRAIKKAEQIRKREIKSIEKQLKKIKEMRFL